MVCLHASAQQPLLKLKGIVLLVTKLDRSLEWYGSNLGFNVSGRSSLAGVALVTLELNGFEIQLQESTPKYKLSIKFTTHDVKAVHEKMKRNGVSFISEVITDSLTKSPLGEVQPFIMTKDPDGHYICIVQE